MVRSLNMTQRQTLEVIHLHFLIMDNLLLIRKYEIRESEKRMNFERCDVKRC